MFERRWFFFILLICFFGNRAPAKDLSPVDGVTQGKPGVVMLIPTNRHHPDRKFRGAAVLDMGKVNREDIDLELERAKEVMPDPSRPINVAVYVADDLPELEQRELLEVNETKFRAVFPNVHVFARYVPRAKITASPDPANALVVAEVPVDEDAVADALPGTNQTENLILAAGSVRSSERFVNRVGIAKGAISFAYWMAKPLGLYRLFLLATEPAIEIGYTLNQRRFSHWARTHNILFHRQLEKLSALMAKKKSRFAAIPSAIARTYRQAEIPKSWLINIGVFFVLRPGWGKLVNHWADTSKPSPFHMQFLYEIGFAGAAGILFYVLGDKGAENLRRSQIATGALHREFLAATSFISLMSLLLYTANPDPLTNWPLLAALATEWGSYALVYGASRVMAPVNNRFVVIDERLFGGNQAETTNTVLEELENRQEALAAESATPESRQALIDSVRSNPRLLRVADDKNFAQRAARFLNFPHRCAARIARLVWR